ncbi:MAG: hypothetical protein QM762_05380 [Chryseolinea sp.]
MSGRIMTTAAVMAEVLQDFDYYRNSGGGVTVSGGEGPPCSPVLITAILRSSAQGIHTAIESNLLVSWERLRPILEATDLSCRLTSR